MYALLPQFLMVESITGHKLVEIKDTAIVLESLKNGSQTEKEMIQVVLAIGVKSSRTCGVKGVAKGAFNYRLSMLL